MVFLSFYLEVNETKFQHFPIFPDCYLANYNVFFLKAEENTIVIFSQSGTKYMNDGMGLENSKESLA